MENNTIDLKLINDVIKKQWRRYLNIKKINENTDDIYVLSYKKMDTSNENEEISYIKDIINKYIDVLNNKKDKTISLDKANIKEYEKWRSFVLDYISQSWEWYKAWESLIKYIIKKNNNDHFSFDDEFLMNLLNSEEYIFIIFFMDVFNNNINSMSLNNFFNSKFQNIDELMLFIQSDYFFIKDILEKEKICNLDMLFDNIDLFLDFQETINDLKNKNKETLISYFIDFLMSISLKPTNLWKNILWEYVFNRKEIIKSNKTETKIDKTFSNDIFHMALYDSIVKI